MLIYLKVKPNQSRRAGNMVEKAGVVWQIRLTAAAIDGKANEQLVEFLSEVLEISKSKIRLKKGQTSRLKCLDIEADEELVYAKLEASINKTM
ncbi:MAG: DUF167 domain-containing protein [Bacteroidota bacterium]